MAFMQMQTTPRQSTHSTHTHGISFGEFNALYLRFECPHVHFEFVCIRFWSAERRLNTEAYCTLCVMVLKAEYLSRRRSARFSQRTINTLITLMHFYVRCDARTPNGRRQRRRNGERTRYHHHSPDTLFPLSDRNKRKWCARRWPPPIASFKHFIE